MGSSMTKQILRSNSTSAIFLLDYPALLSQISPHLCIYICCTFWGHKPTNTLSFTSQKWKSLILWVFVVMLQEYFPQLLFWQMVVLCFFHCISNQNKLLYTPYHVVTMRLFFKKKIGPKMSQRQQKKFWDFSPKSSISHTCQLLVEKCFCIGFVWSSLCLSVGLSEL